MGMAIASVLFDVKLGTETLRAVPDVDSRRRFA
jgi:hypothetical protein